MAYSGNQDAIDSYNSLRLMKPNGVVSVNGAPTVTLGTIRNANPDLKWEGNTYVQCWYRCRIFRQSFYSRRRLL